jgi:carotenoid cleavage dioxygenase-like enzyme
MLVLYHVGANGQLRTAKVVPLDFAGYMHDFVLTPRFLIALNSSAVVGTGDTFVDRIKWQPERPAQLLVFDRNDFSLRATIEVPAAFVFHFGNGWEQGERISFTACQYADASLVTKGMRQLAQQDCGDYHSRPELKLYSIDLAKAGAQVEPAGLALEFPGFDRAAPFAAQALVGVGGHDKSASSLGNAIVRFDPRTGATQRFDYGDGVIVEEPLYVPAKGGGYIIHSLLDYRHRRSGLAILKAEHLADGPLAMAVMNRVLPLGFHGCFCPRLPEPRDG